MSKKKYLFYCITGVLTGLLMVVITSPFIANLSVKLFGEPTLFRTIVGLFLGFLLILFFIFDSKRDIKKYVNED